MAAYAKEDFYTARVPLCQVSDEGIVESANTALGQMFGLAVPTLIGTPLEAIGDGEEALDNPLKFAAIGCWDFSTCQHKTAICPQRSRCVDR